MIVRTIIIAGLLLAIPAMADNSEDAAPQLRELINCFPAKGITEFVAKFNGMEAEKRDTVDMMFSAKFKVKDGGILPERIFLRDGEAEDNFTLAPDGSVPDFQKIGAASETAELCSEDPTRIGTPRGGDEMSFSLTNDVHFLKSDGYHDLATLEEGLKDGKSHYKKMVPAAMRMLVPSLKYVMIEYEADNTAPQYTAMKGDVPVAGLTHETFCKTAMIKVKDLKKLGADGLQITGGAYSLTPVPGRKTLEKFAGCSDDDQTESETKAQEE